MDSPGSKAQPPKNSPTRGQSWTPSTSYTWPVMLSTSAAGAPGKNFTISAGVPRIPCTRPAECLHTRSCLLTPRQQHQILDLFASDCHVALEVTWSAYQNITRRLPHTRHGRGQGHHGSRNQHPDLHARTEEPDRAHQRWAERSNAEPQTSWPTSTTPTPQAALPKPSTHPLEHLRGSALEFRNLTNYIARCLLETGGFRPQLHPQL